jgi:hypothetical protein
MSSCDLSEFGLSADNTLINCLVPEDLSGKGKTQFSVRQVNHAHYTLVAPESVPEPSLVDVSESCAAMLNIDEAGD